MKRKAKFMYSFLGIFLAVSLLLLTFDYFSQNDNFSSIAYVAIDSQLPKQIALSTDHGNENIKGIELNNERYLIDLIACDYNQQACFFKINGVSTGALHSKEISTKSKFGLDENHQIEISSITWDYCGNRRFCNLHYESNHIVDLVVMAK